MRHAFREIVGVWPVEGTPELVHLDGRVYRRARWRQRYPGALEQYREDVSHDSEHLFVMRDGTFRITHRDRFNPDHGRPLSHFLADHPLGRAAMALGVIARFFV